MANVERRAVNTALVATVGAAIVAPPLMGMYAAGKRIGQLRAERAAQLAKQAKQALDAKQLGKETAAVVKHIKVDPSLPTQPYVGVNFTPSINPAAVAEAMIALGELKAGDEGKKAVVKVIQGQSVYVQYEGNALPNAIQNAAQKPLIIVAPKATATANLERDTRTKRVVPTDFPLFQAISESVDSVVAPLVAKGVASAPPQPDHLAVTTENVEIGAGVGLLVAGLTRLLLSKTHISRRGAVQGIVAVPAAIVAADVADGISAGQRIIGTTDGLYARTQQNVSVGPLTGKSYGDVNAPYDQLVRSQAFQANVAGNLVRQTPVLSK